MCLGVPMKLLSIDGIAGLAEGIDGVELIDLSLCDHAKTGDWVLGFLGAAREVISADDAAKITAGELTDVWRPSLPHFVIWQRACRENDGICVMRCYFALVHKGI